MPPKKCPPKLRQTRLPWAPEPKQTRVRKPKKVYYDRVEERSTIVVPILGEIAADQAIECIEDPVFLCDVYRQGWDPCYVWRYLRYRLNGVYKDLVSAEAVSMTALFDALHMILEDEDS